MLNQTIAERDSDTRRQGASPVFHGANARLIYPLLAYKFFILWLVLASAQLLPNSFSFDGFNANFRWPEDKEPGLDERFMTWDGEHYLYLSQNGYHAGSPSAAFFPLWPALIWLNAKLLAGQTLIAALVLSNIFSLFAWLLFHQLVAVEYGDELADCATI